MFLPDFMIRNMSIGVETEQMDEPLIYPFNEECLGPASYDLTVAANFASPSEMKGFIYRNGQKYHALQDSKEFADIKLKAGEQLGIVLNPGQPVLCHAVERVALPPTCVVQLYTRSRYARQWLNHSTATGIWPGFKGQITFELKNEGVEPFVIKSGDRVLQIAFCKMLAPPEKVYNGLYQNQKAQLHSLRLIDIDTVMP